jgi:hypothetical protein
MIQFSPSVVLFFGVGLLFISLALVKFNRSRTEKNNDNSSIHGQPSSTNDHSYKAVSIVTLPGSCEAAHKMQGKMFLNREAPSLPLKKCTQPDCLCSYKHFSDRRKKPDRRNLITLWKERYRSTQHDTNDRRRIRERRGNI